MVKSHGDFVTIIDLPEGEHQYKFYVDGEWKHDPKLKNVRSLLNIYLLYFENMKFISRSRMIWEVKII